ncbi:MAG: nucleoside deaminase [Clostridia bacterium]|nr:nucleoside deaminase [Clostridia bacterium]
MDKIRFMRLAIKEAKKAELIDEVPIGAVIVKDGKVIARAHNKKESKNQATRHAEIEAIEKATKKVNNWWLEDCDIYVTLEPCAMCAGALINSRLRNIYFGAYDKKAGCCGSLYNLPIDVRFNHRLGVEGGILEEECATLLTNYFKKKRK